MTYKQSTDFTLVVSTEDGYAYARLTSDGQNVMSVRHLVPEGCDQAKGELEARLVLADVLREMADRVANGTQ